MMSDVRGGVDGFVQRGGRLRAERASNGVAALLVCALIGVGAMALIGLARTPVPTQVELAAYATSLRGRTGSQRHNALKAAAALNGITIAPDAILSYNATVKSWSQDQGYVKAPVSYDGELVRAFGGGVCQTSTTLYNAALLAGLPIVERHPHVFAPHYVPPGQDAAVAQPNIDLRIKNPYPWPIRLRTSSDEDVLTIHILGAARPANTIRVEQKVLATEMPAHLTRVLHVPEGRPGRAYVRNPGSTGYRVLTYRLFIKAGRVVRRERLGDDSYQAMDRIVQVAEESNE